MSGGRQAHCCPQIEDESGEQEKRKESGSQETRIKQNVFVLFSFSVFLLF
jgi:hypothetical protein